MERIVSARLQDDPHVEERLYPAMPVLPRPAFPAYFRYEPVVERQPLAPAPLPRRRDIGSPAALDAFDVPVYPHQV